MVNFTISLAQSDLFVPTIAFGSLRPPTSNLTIQPEARTFFVLRRPRSYKTGFSFGMVSRSTFTCQKTGNIWASTAISNSFTMTEKGERGPGRVKIGMYMDKGG